MIAHCINTVMRYGNINDSLELWVRMSNNGHITSKFEIKDMIEKIRISGKKDLKVDINFVKKLHKKMVENVWDQTYDYYHEILLLCKHYVLYSVDFVSILKYCREYNMVWKQCMTLNENGGNLLNDGNSIYKMNSISKSELEIYANDMDCWVKVCINVYKYVYILI